jgi:hypothetical protein
VGTMDAMKQVCNHRESDLQVLNGSTEQEVWEAKKDCIAT